jgi:hypothetical protein
LFTAKSVVTLRKRQHKMSHVTLRQAIVGDSRASIPMNIFVAMDLFEQARKHDSFPIFSSAVDLVNSTLLRISEYIIPDDLAEILQNYIRTCSGDMRLRLFRSAMYNLPRDNYVILRFIMHNFAKWRGLPKYDLLSTLYGGFLMNYHDLSKYVVKTLAEGYSFIFSIKHSLFIHKPLMFQDIRIKCEES